MQAGSRRQEAGDSRQEESGRRKEAGGEYICGESSKGAPQSSTSVILRSITILFLYILLFVCSRTVSRF